MPRSSRYKLTKTEEKELRQKLAKNLMAIVGISILMVVILIFFAPKLGVFFGFFSKNRNQADTFNVIKPNPPFFTNVPNATKEDTFSLSGFAQAGLTINLFVNGPQVQNTTVGADGQFTFNNIPLIQGSNTFFAKAIDKNGVESDQSTNYTITQDKEKPDIEISSPKDNEVVKNLDKRVQIKGKLSEKAMLIINGKTAIVRPDLTFEFLLGVKEGENEIKIEATDEAGNEQEENFKINYKNSIN